MDLKVKDEFDSWLLKNHPDVFDQLLNPLNPNSANSILKLNDKYYQEYIQSLKKENKVIRDEIDVSSYLYVLLAPFVFIMLAWSYVDADTNGPHFRYGAYMLITVFVISSILRLFKLVPMKSYGNILISMFLVFMAWIGFWFFLEGFGINW